MKPFNTLSDIRARSAEAILSQSSVRNTALLGHLRSMFNSPSTAEGGLLQQPIVEGAHPFVPADVDMGGVDPSVLHPDFVAAIDALPNGSDYRFPKKRQPFKHQLEAWRHLSSTGNPQSVLVTSGTGSGKTECFLFPILSDLVSQAKGRSAPLEGVQAIMLYPLNALIESQRERLSAWTRPFDGKVRYCLYNGDLPNSQPTSLHRATPEQQVDREQLRESPPPVSEWSATAYLDRWRFLGNRVVIVIPDGFVSRCDTAGRLALYDLGQRFAQAGGSTLRIGAAPEINGLTVGIAVTSQSGVKVWATRDSSSWEANPEWGQPMSAPIIMGSTNAEIQTTVVELGSLLPAASSHFERISTELDRSLSLFGAGMANRLRARLESVGIPKAQAIRGISYSDPYIRSPLVAKMFIDTVAGLLKGAAGVAVELSTGAPGGKLNMPSRIFDDWRESVDAEAVMSEYAKLKGIDLKIQFAQVPHGRYMTIAFEGGTSATIVFDQGFGAWRTTSSGHLVAHDFRTSPRRQAEALSRSSVSVAKSGYGPTYIVASKDS